MVILTAFDQVSDRIEGLSAGVKPGQRLKVRAEENGKVREFTTVARIDTPDDVEYLKHGGILPYVLRQLLAHG